MQAATKKIQEYKERKRDWLDLSDLKLNEIPIEIRELKNLRRLSLNGNPVKVLPNWLFNIISLEVLDLRNMMLTEIPSKISNLINLNKLLISYNEIKSLPEEMQELDKLEVLFATNNLIEIIPSWTLTVSSINFNNNPVIDPPLEIYNRGIHAIKNYFEEKEKGKQKIYEAKLIIVGEPGSGKTSLMRKLINDSYELNPEETSTLGIEINPYFFLTNENIDFRMNIWDFGGQEIYHATHQFFLTKRSLYILLSDNRAEDTDFNYWLQIIELFSENSPVILFQNEKQNRKKDINVSGIRERFSNTLKSFSFNLSNNTDDFARLKKEIQHEIQLLPHIGNELPISWVKIRNDLETISTDSPYISDNTYYDICKRLGGFDVEQSLLLSEYFHDLGTFLHFKENSILKRWIILKPEWGTDAVYNVLDSELVINNSGYFTRENLKEIWHEKQYIDMHDELLALMMKFELCYKVENQEIYIAPQLLSRNKPSYTWQNTGNSILIYDFDFLPKGIMTRLIVRMHYYIEDQNLVWREGVILKRENTRAEIIQPYGKKEILIQVEGLDKKEFLAIIIDQVDRIISEFKKIKVKKMIPCNCELCVQSDKKHYYEYDLLRKFMLKNIKTERCALSISEVKISNLINDALGNVGQKMNYHIYISYSSNNNNDLDLFKKHLKPLLYSFEFKSWDKSMIRAGENMSTEKSEKINNAEIILALITIDYLNDEECIGWELNKALELRDINDVLFIPIIMRACDYKTSEFAGIKPVIIENTPIFSHKDVDLSLNKVVAEISSTIKEYKDKKNKYAEYF